MFKHDTMNQIFLPIDLAVKYQKSYRFLGG